MKTAVEWLQEQYNQCPKYEEQIYEQDWEQAKEMEKEQHKKTYFKGWDSIGNRDEDFEQYYNETFKQQEQ
jgi:hypothetical protein